MNQYTDLEYKIMELIRTTTNSRLLSQGLVLGGYPGPSGGGGGPYIPVVGQLPQTLVTFDTSESTSDIIPTSGSSLVNNLNRIRSGIAIRPSYIPTNYVVTSGDLNNHLAGIDVALVSMSGLSGGHVIQDADETFPQRKNLKFVGGTHVYDDAAADATIVTTSGFVVISDVSPSPDGSTTTFSVLSGPYIPNSTLVFVNGQLQTINVDYLESNPVTGEIVFTSGAVPESGDYIKVLTSLVGFSNDCKMAVNVAVVPSADGSTTTFSVVTGYYRAKTLIVTMNGLTQRPGSDFYEVDPEVGTFSFYSAPPSGASILTHFGLYNSSETYSETRRSWFLC